MVRQALISGRVALVPLVSTALARKDTEPGVLGWSSVTGGMSVGEGRSPGGSLVSCC